MGLPRYKVIGSLNGVHVKTDFAFETVYGAKQYVIETGIDPYNIVVNEEQ